MRTQTEQEMSKNPMEELTITLQSQAEIKGMDQLIKFFLQCDVVHNPRYADATKIAREVQEYIEKHREPAPG